MLVFNLKGSKGRLNCMVLFGFIILLSIVSVIFSTSSVMAISSDKQNTKDLLYIQLDSGLVIIETFPNIAPKHVARIKELTQKGFYNNLTFHRVISGFMAQGGDPNGNGTGGSGQKINAEFSNISHTRGIVSMARASDENSADSQFFIMLGNYPFLDGKYTVWGRVIEGMEHVDKIKLGDKNRDGIVTNPTRIVSMYFADDVNYTIKQQSGKLKN